MANKRERFKPKDEALLDLKARMEAESQAKALEESMGFKISGGSDVGKEKKGDTSKTPVYSKEGMTSEEVKKAREAGMMGLQGAGEAPRKETASSEEETVPTPPKPEEAPLATSHTIEVEIDASAEKGSEQKVEPPADQESAVKVETTTNVTITKKTAKTSKEKTPSKKKTKAPASRKGKEDAAEQAIKHLEGNGEFEAVVKAVTNEQVVAGLKQTVYQKSNEIRAIEGKLSELQKKGGSKTKEWAPLVAELRKQKEARSIAREELKNLEGEKTVEQLTAEAIEIQKKFLRKVGESNILDDASRRERDDIIAQILIKQGKGKSKEELHKLKGKILKQIQDRAHKALDKKTTAPPKDALKPTPANKFGEVDRYREGKPKLGEYSEEKDEILKSRMRRAQGMTPLASEPLMPETVATLEEMDAKTKEMAEIAAQAPVGAEPNIGMLTKEEMEELRAEIEKTPNGGGAKGPERSTEQELSLRDVLENARKEYITKYHTYLKDQQKEKRLGRVRGYFSGVKAVGEESLPQDLKDAKHAYDNARVAYGNRLLQETSKEIEAKRAQEYAGGMQDVEALKQAYAYKDVYEFIAHEQDILEKERARDWTPRQQNLYRKVFSRFMQMDAKTRLAATVLLYTGIGAVSGGIGAGAALGAKRLVRGATGIFAAAIAGKVIDGYYREDREALKIEEEKEKESFRTEGLSLQSLQMLEKNQQKIAEKKWKLERKAKLIKLGVAVLGGVGVAAMMESYESGELMRKVEAVKESAGESSLAKWFSDNNDKPEDTRIPSGATGTTGIEREAEESVGKIIQEEVPAARTTGESIVQAKGGSFDNRLEEFQTVKKGDTIWGKVHDQLKARMAHDPSVIGLTNEDLGDADKIRKALDKETLRLLKEQGYIQEDGSNRIVRPGMKVILEDNKSIRLEGDRKEMYSPRVGPKESVILEPTEDPRTYAERLADPVSRPMAEAELKASVNLLPDISNLSLREAMQRVVFESIGFTENEFKAIESVKVEKFLQEIPDHGKARWSLFGGPKINGHKVDLPHQGLFYNGAEFEKHIALVEQIRSMKPGQGELQKSIGQFLMERTKGR